VKGVVTYVITKEFWCGLFRVRAIFWGFLAFVREETWCKGPMEQLRCAFVVSTCVDSENGELLMVKGQVCWKTLQHGTNIVSRTWIVWLGWCIWFKNDLAYAQGG